MLQPSRADENTAEIDIGVELPARESQIVRARSIFLRAMVRLAAIVMVLISVLALEKHRKDWAL